METLQFRDEPWNEFNPDRVQVLAPAFCIFGHPDLEKAETFLTNFGLKKVGSSDDTLYFAGYGRHSVSCIAQQTEEPRFLGLFYEAASQADLEKAVMLPGAGAIVPFTGPGGGNMVTIIDPSKLPFGIIFGNAKKNLEAPKSELLPYNFPAADDSDTNLKPRRGVFQRLTPGVVPVHKLGHGGWWANDINESARFYMRHFNFKPSDIMLDPQSAPNLIFLHVDLGQTYTDHHSLIIGQAAGPIPVGPHHCAFEIESIDHQFIGHEFLKKQGYSSFWGVGRHVEGSQVFDYWFDICGFLVEHYADGDLVNEDTQINWVPNEKQGNTWGPNLPNMRHR